MPFSHIRGLGATTALLQRSLASRRTAHAYLFSGTDGCGKKLTATAFIEALFCGKTEGCGVCPSCRKIAAGQHPDLHVVEPEGTFIKIDQIRELQKVLSYRPFEAPQKACIIDGAEKLNAASGNALLKTLEEPPGNAVLILLTSNAGSVLPTILSRCQQLQFPALPQAAMADFLVEQGYSPERAAISASLAGGSMRKALELCAEDAGSRRSQLFERLCGLSVRNIAPLFATAEELAADKESVPDILGMLALFFRDALLIREGSGDVANTDIVPLLHREAGANSREAIMEKIAHVENARQALLRNVNPRLTLEVLLMRLASRNDPVGRHGLRC